MADTNVNENNNNNNLFNENNNNNITNVPPPLPVLPGQNNQPPLPTYHNENQNENINTDTPNNIFNNNDTSEEGEKKTLGNMMNEVSIDSQGVENSSEINPSVEFNQMLNRVMKSDIPREDKIKILLKFKADMLNPGRGERQELDRLESQYSQLVNPDMSTSTEKAAYPGSFTMPQTPMQPQMQHPMPQQHFMYAGQQPYLAPYPVQQPNFGYMMPPYPMMPQQSQQTMSNQQFEILKNKLDTIQLEMIDVVRHLKDYSKKYMLAVRQDDMSKLDTYVRDLINVDKKLENTQKAVNDQREAIEEAVEEAKEEEEGQSLFGRATSGMKNVMGSIGNNIGSVSDLVKNTASATNDMLKKNILPADEPNQEKKNENVVSVDQYAKDTETATPAPVESAPQVEPTAPAQPEPTPEPVASPPTEAPVTSPVNDDNDDNNDDNDVNKPQEVATPPIGESTGNAGAPAQPEAKLQDEINNLDKKIKNEIAKNIGTEVQSVQQGGSRNKTKKKKNLKNRRKTPKKQPKKSKKRVNRK